MGKKYTINQLGLSSQLNFYDVPEQAIWALRERYHLDCVLEIPAEKLLQFANLPAGRSRFGLNLSTSRLLALSTSALIDISKATPTRMHFLAVTDQDNGDGDEGNDDENEFEEDGESDDDDDDDEEEDEGSDEGGSFEEEDEGDDHNGAGEDKEDAETDSDEDEPDSDEDEFEEDEEEYDDDEYSLEDDEDDDDEDDDEDAV